MEKQGHMGSILGRGGEGGGWGEAGKQARQGEGVKWEWARNGGAQLHQIVSPMLSLTPNTGFLDSGPAHDSPQN